MTHSPDKVDVIGQIGKGIQATSDLCSRNGQLLVRKRYKKEKWAVHRTGIPREIFVLQTIPAHSRILGLESYNIRRDGSLDIFFQYCSGGNLRKQEPPRGYGRSEGFVWEVFIQVADALALMHHGYNHKSRYPDALPSPSGLPVVHRDIKPENVFFCRKPTPSEPCPPLVLGDFGVATTLQRTTVNAGTAMFQPPEWPICTVDNDVWGLGAIVHTLCHGTAPVAALPEYGRACWGQARKAEWFTKHKRVRVLGEEYSEELNVCMMACLRTNSQERINSRALVKNVLRGRENFRVTSLSSERE